MTAEPGLDTESFRERLREQRDSLVAIGEASEDSRRPVTLDQQSVGRVTRMDAMQAQAMALAADDRRRRQLRRIDAALARIDDGVFGYCVACGEAIAGKRLANDPAAPNCVRCAGASDD